MGEIYILAVSPKLSAPRCRKSTHDLCLYQIKQKGWKWSWLRRVVIWVMPPAVKPMRTLVLNNGLLLATLKVITNSSLSTIVGDKS